MSETINNTTELKNEPIIIPADAKEELVQVPASAVNVEYGGTHINPEEGCMIISDRLDFRFDELTYSITTDGYMGSDQTIVYDPHGELPNILKPYAEHIDKFVDDHCAMEKKITFRQFIFVDGFCFKTFIMVDTNPLNPDVRPYDSINMLAAYLGADPHDWSVFCDHIIDGDIFRDKIYEIRQKRKGGYRRVYEYTRNLLFLCNEKEYSDEEFDPEPFERSCNFFYVNRTGLKEALNASKEPECPDEEWAVALDESETDDDRNDGIADPEE